jgi:ribose 5-phosphate isomerase B
MNISIGSDHAGYHLKERLKSHMADLKSTLFDKGTFSEESTDYPEFAHAVAQSVADNESQLGILICGSGNGVAMSANKHKDIRCALCWNAELAALARAHNNANVLALPSRFISEDLAIEIVDAFLNTDFEGGRHARRVNKIAC